MPSSSSEEFLKSRSAFWIDAIKSVAGPNPPPSVTWTAPSDIERVLKVFAVNGYNHAHLPSGGGFDAIGVRASSERDRLAIQFGDKFDGVFAPKSLTLEYFSRSPIDSFILLEMGEMNPSGVDKSFRDGDIDEELVDLMNGRYAARRVWDDNSLGEDYEGNEIPLPVDATLVRRFLNGKIMIVAKGSWWNGQSATYDGRHTDMTAPEIRRMIESRQAGPFVLRDNPSQ